MLLSRRFVEKKRSRQENKITANEEVKPRNTNNRLTEALDTFIKILGVGRIADKIRDSRKNSNLKIEDLGIYDSLANRKVVKNSLDYAKYMLSVSGIKLKDPPLAPYKANINALEPIYFKTANALWILPDLNVKAMETVFPKFLPTSVSRSLIKTATACCELIVSMSMIPSGIAYMGLYFLANEKDEKETDDCDNIPMNDLKGKKYILPKENSTANSEFVAEGKVRPVCRRPA